MPIVSTIAPLSRNLSTNTAILTVDRPLSSKECISPLVIKYGFEKPAVNETVTLTLLATVHNVFFGLL